MIDGERAAAEMGRRRRQRFLKRALRVGLVLYAGAFFYYLLLHEAPYEPRGLEYLPVGEKFYTPWGVTILFSAPVLFFGWAIVSAVRERIDELRWK